MFIFLLPPPPASSSWDHHHHDYRDHHLLFLLFATPCSPTLILTTLMTTTYITTMITRITTYTTTMMLTYHLAMLAYTLRLPAHGYCPRSPEHLCHPHDSDEVINLGYEKRQSVCGSKHSKSPSTLRHHKAQQD